MWETLKRFFRPRPPTERSPSTQQRAPEGPPTAYTIRFGKAVPIDDAFQAWTSGDLERMLSVLNTKTNLVDRHFLLLGIVGYTYKRRKDPKMAEICSSIAELHLAEFPQIAPALKKDLGIMPRVPTFQQYATLLTEQGEFDKAIEVCEKALSFTLHDNTESGFEGRIERISRKRAAHKQPAS